MSLFLYNFFFDEFFPGAQFREFLFELGDISYIIVCLHKVNHGLYMVFSKRDGYVEKVCDQQAVIYVQLPLKTRSNRT